MLKRCISVFLVIALMLGVAAVIPASAYESNDYAETSADNDWYALYWNFLREQNYYLLADYYTTVPEFTLHDMDFDGNPELLSTFGGIGLGTSHYVFTIKDGQIVYAGTLGSGDGVTFYHMNSSYRGLYSQSGRQGSYWCSYYYMENYKIVSKNVFTTMVPPNSDSKPKITVNNSNLYSAYKKATEYSKEWYYSFGMRKARYNIEGYDRSEIFGTLGYNNFVKKYQFLAIPKIKKFENVQSGAKITWNSIKGAEKYKVYVKSGSSWKTVGTTTETSLIHKSAKSSKSYTYTVKCISADETRATSRYISAGFKNKFIATPKLRSIKNKTDGVRFVFYQVSGASKYRIYRKTEGTSWKKVGDVSSKKDYFLDKTAKKGVTYTYTVRCVSSDGKKHVSGYDKTGLTIRKK